MALLIGYDRLFALAKGIYRAMPEIRISQSELPLPSGPFGVSYVAISIPLSTSGPTSPSTMTIDLWYPSESSENSTRPGVRVVGSGGAKRVKAGAVNGARVARVSARLPLVLYAPGWGGSRDSNTFVFADLASHGYVVAAMDDVGHVPHGHPTAPERELTLGPFDLSSKQAMMHSVMAANERLRLMTARVSATLDYLAKPDLTDRVPLLEGRIDATRAGMFGFSFGGAVAAESALKQNRLVAVANMDGTQFGSSAVTVVPKPFLIFSSDVSALDADSKSSDLGRRQAAQLDLADLAHKTIQARQSDSTMLLFKKVDHSDFTDDLFSPSVTSYINRWHRTSAERLQLQYIQKAYLLAFFDRYLRGVRDQPLLNKALPPFAGVELLAATPKSTR